METQIKIEEDSTPCRNDDENTTIPTQSITAKNILHRNGNYALSSDNSPNICLKSGRESATSPSSSSLQKLAQPTEEHKPMEIQVVPNRFSENEHNGGSAKATESKLVSSDDEIVTVHIDSLHVNTDPPEEKNNGDSDENSNDNYGHKNEERYGLKRTHDKSDKTEESEEYPTKKYYIDKNYRRYEAPLIYPKTSASDYQFYEKTRESSYHGDYATKVYPIATEPTKHQIMYVPVEEISDKEAMYRRAYYEEMLQRELQFQAKSAFKKPPNFDRELPEVKVIVPAIRYEYNYVPQYLPYYEQFQAREEENGNSQKLALQETEKKRQFERIQDEHCKPDETLTQKAEFYDKYRLYEANKYASMNPRFPLPTEYPYHPYTAPLMSWDKIHVETKCPYPCCTSSERLQPKDTNNDKYDKMSRYGSTPVYSLSQIKTDSFHVDGKTNQSMAYDHSGIKPGFKELLDAERQSMAENVSALEKLSTNSIAKKKSQFLKLWDETKKDGSNASEMTNSASIETKPIEEPTKGTELPPKETKMIETTETQIQNADSTSQKKAPVTTDTADPNAKKISCSVCNKTFNRTSNLYTHMKTHSTHKPHACEFCGKRFHQKADLRIHRYIHTGEKPHKCTKCGRGFKQLTHLKYHMRTHSDVRMYKCPYCEKGFNQKSNLQAHIFGHTGQRPHKCDVCGKGFTLASTLNTHKRTHLPNKPFQCQFCERAFYQKNALKMHYVSTHPYASGAV